MFNFFFQKYRFSDKEIKHILVGTLLFTAVMVSIALGNFTLEEIILLIILTAPLFFLHEIGHKINAQKFNLWAEFRLDPQGALITAISIVSPIKFVAPGAVMIRANDYSEIPAMGKVAGYGPAINIFLGGIYQVLSGVCYILLLVMGIDVSSLFYVFFYATGFGFFLGVFNMIPFGPLDGKKVKMWNENTFWIMFIISGLLTIETYGSLVFNTSPYFLGSFLITINPYIGVFYPIVLGIVIIGIGYYLLVHLSDPNWEPSKKRVNYDYSSDFYYSKMPNVSAVRSGNPSSSSAPMNAPCTECGKKDLLPFRCSSCGKIYCAEHRLPGSHFCVKEY